VRRYVRHTFANTQSALMKKRVSQYMISSECPLCKGKRLQQESLSVKFAGYDIAELSRLALDKLATIFAPYATGEATALKKMQSASPEKVEVAKRIAEDFVARLQVMLDLGLGYLTIERSTPTLSPGELQRLRLATQVRSNLFGVVYVLDEPSAGLHPADTEALLRALDKLKAAGNSLFVVEHEIDVIRHADWIVDVGPAAGEKGGHILYSGLPEGLREVKESLTRHYIYDDAIKNNREVRMPKDWLKLECITRNNLSNLNASFPLAVLTIVTGVSGSGKSSLVSQVLVELIAEQLGLQVDITADTEGDPLEQTEVHTLGGKITSGMKDIKRLVVVDQKPIGRTPRSNLATYTGLFDHVRKLFAVTQMAKARKFDAGQFSFNVAKGRCPHCEGEGMVMVELLFLPSVYTPCPTCSGTRYNPKTLEVQYKDKNIAEVLALTVDEAASFFDGEPAISRALEVVREVGLGYLRLGQPATELSGGEAQRIKLATELQRAQHGQTLYILDEPTTGLHPADVERLLIQLNRLVDAGNTVVLVEHDMEVIAASDWVIDIGPGAGEAGGQIVAEGTPVDIIKNKRSRTAPYLAKHL
jgi:excinuclease ABC subunit A